LSEHICHPDPGAVAVQHCLQVSLVVSEVAINNLSILVVGVSRAGQSLIPSEGYIRPCFVVISNLDILNV